ncbi:hypothetical protein CHLNCDRAFT_144516 [Chlorella variabilis]|uniref:Rhamnogalacturonase A/B/Epimerase-like pectate lyase domain-containing protein n=1 Tax=Chlorella variabilis TaxID=554065 RepID=E1ZBL3_CHLVA|nr:hypothetical protein CHLNCDRAFT_144516 [Chlorella variabilis]EFN56876.1 hypothetical protein CHLNCDRAFT_144516 [Chlorella variabilis]|eukprot:XP_005848978.1 hypothetical protein CHLNCDRAFT_144516 [Chlorella variabilis]
MNTLLWALTLLADGQEPLPSQPVKFNVKDFGAKGDGVARDTQALQAAVAAANADPEGGVVYLPAGTYLLDSTLVVERANVVLRGDGANATTIYIPNSLSDVFTGTWVNVSGKVKSSWDSSGGFITFKGRKQTSLLVGPLLANIAGNVEPGDFRLPVDSTAKFQAGQPVRIWVNDESTTGVSSGTDKAPAAGLPGEAAGGDEGLPVPDWVKQDPTYQAALAAGQGMEEPEDGSDGGGGSRDGGGEAGGGGKVYGDNMADSGPDSGILSRDQIAFTARVAAIGEGWVELDRPMSFAVREWWKGVVHVEQPSLQDAGMEKLTIRFKHSMFGDHFSDRGYNAIQAVSGVNLFFSEINIINCDNGINLFFVDHSTVQDVTIDVTSPRWGRDRAKDAFNGHHPITVTMGHSNLITRFSINAKWIHDLSVAYGASLNAFTAGRGLDLNVDHHRAGPWANLFTNINVGCGSRPFFSSGRQGKGAHDGKPSRRPLELPGCDLGPLLNFVGAFVKPNCRTKMKWLVEALNASSPADLHRAQVAARRAASVR